MRGWDLVAGRRRGAPVLSIRRGFDNEEPLVAAVPVLAPGTYDLILKVNDMDEDL